MTNVVFTQQTQSSCENYALDLWFRSILQLGNYYFTERRTENIRLKCKRYCLGQVVIMKLLKMKIICTEDNTYSWNPPPPLHNGMRDIYSTQTAMFITQIIQWHRNFHHWPITLWQEILISKQSILAPAICENLNVFLFLCPYCTEDLKILKNSKLPTAMKNVTKLNTPPPPPQNTQQKKTTTQKKKKTHPPPPPPPQKAYYTMAWKPKIHQMWCCILILRNDKL